MQDFATQHQVALVRGQGWPLMVAASVIGLLAVAVPIGYSMAGEMLPWNNVQRVWMLVGTVVCMLFIAGGVQNFRCLAFRSDGQVEITGPVFGRCFGSDRISDITFRRECSGYNHQNSQSYLVFWEGSRELARINVMFWRRPELGALLQMILLSKPSIQVGPEARKLIPDHAEHSWGLAPRVQSSSASAEWMRRPI